MLFAPAGSWNFKVSNVKTFRPAAAYGSPITPGTGGTKGTWSYPLQTTLANEVFGLLIYINNCSTSATTRNVLVDIGIDTTGGNNPSVLIPNLIGGHAAPATVGGIYYYFPIYIPKGAAVGVRASGTTATSFNIALYCYGNPSRPDAVIVGTKVTAFGVTSASSTGTIITAGTTSDGAWTQLGSATTHPIFWWQCGMTCIDTTMTANAHAMDIAVGGVSSKTIVLEDALAIFTAAEQNSMFPAATQAYNASAVGNLVYGRIQCSGTADSNLSMVAYGLG